MWVSGRVESGGASREGRGREHWCWWVPFFAGGGSGVANGAPFSRQWLVCFSQKRIHLIEDARDNPAAPRIYIVTQRI